jgi:hypothetical protein
MLREREKIVFLVFIQRRRLMQEVRQYTEIWCHKYLVCRYFDLIKCHAVKLCDGYRLIARGYHINKRTLSPHFYIENPF